METNPEEIDFQSLIDDFKKSYRHAGGVKAYLKNMLKDENAKNGFLNALKTSHPGKSSDFKSDDASAQRPPHPDCTDRLLDRCVASEGMLTASDPH